MTFASSRDIEFLGADPIPTDAYQSQAYFERERGRIFRRAWLFFAREEEIPEAGDFLVKEYDICGASVLVVRDKTGTLGAFHNVCSHRLSRLVFEDHGNVNGFSCRYHGWRYGLDGALRYAPDSDQFPGFDSTKCALVPVRLEVWNGFIFINFDPQPRQSLVEFLGPAADKLAEHSFENYESHVVMGQEIEVNWKCILDNFQETYHLSFVHNVSVGDRSVGGDNPLGRPISFEFFGPHRLMGVWGNPDHKFATVEGLAVKHGGVISAGATQQTDAHKRLRHPNWQLDVYGIFPNLLVDMAPTFFFIHEFIPIAPGRTRWFTRIFFPKARNAAQRFSQEYSVAAFRDTVAEDLTILRNQQKAIQSGARKTFLFQTNEAMCRHSFLTVDAWVNGDGAADGSECVV